MTSKSDRSFFEWICHNFISFATSYTLVARERPQHHTQHNQTLGKASSEHHRRRKHNKDMRKSLTSIISIISHFRKHNCDTLLLKGYKSNTCLVQRFGHEMLTQRQRMARFANSGLESLVIRANTCPRID